MGNKGRTRALPPWSATGAQQVLLGNPTSSTPQTQLEGNDTTNDAKIKYANCVCGLLSRGGVVCQFGGLGNEMGVTTLDFSPYVQGIQGSGSPTYGLEQVAGDTKSDFDLSSRAPPKRYTPLPKRWK